MGDFNNNYEENIMRKALKTIKTKYDLVQLVKHPTRLTFTTKSQIDLLLTNKPDRIRKSFNMITGKHHILTRV